MDKDRVGGRVLTFVAVLGAAILSVALLAISATARPARSKAHVRVVKHHPSLLSVRYLPHGRADQLAPGSGSTLRTKHVKQGPTGPVAADAKTRSNGARSANAQSPQVTCTLPSVPGSPTATGGANQAAINWTAANGNGSSITGYVVTAKKGAAAENAQGEPAAATTATLSGLAGGSYTFAVFAQSACGNGPAATTSAATVTGAATYASTVIGLGPAAYFRLGEPAGTATAADSSGHGLLGGYNSNSGITLGNAGALPSDSGATSVTDTNGQWVASVPSPTGLPVGNQARTVQAWVKPTDGDCRWVLGFGANATDQAYNLGECGNSVAVSAFSDDLYFTTPEPLTDGAWHLITVTYDGTNVTAYLDGRSLGTKTFSDPISTAPSGLELGAWENLCCNNWTYGGLQDEAVYPKALTAVQVTSLFKASGYAVPAAPGSPTATGGANAATVKWSASSAPGTTLSGYIVTAKKGTVAEQSIAAPAGATSVKLTGLPSGTYTFTVAGVDDYGTGTAATTSGATVTGATTTYASTVLADRPSVFYRLDEAAPSPLAADSSGHSITASYASCGLTYGVVGPLANDPATGVSSTAGCNIASVAYSAKLPAGDASRTVQAWIKPSDGNCRWFMGYGATYTDGEFAVGNCANSVIVRLYQDDHSFFSARNIADGNWHLVTVTDSFSATTGNTITAYLDGQKLGSQVTNTLDTASSTGLTIGSTPDTCCFYGGVADAAVYPAALSVTEISALMTAAGDSVPTAPTTVAATGGANTATVTWKAATATGTKVSSYIVTEYSAGKAQQRVAVSGTTLSAKIGSLPAGSYTFGVVAYDTYGAGASATSTATSVTGATSTYASQILASKPALYFRLGETGTTVAADSSGNGTLGSYDTTGVTQGVTGALVGDGTDLAASQSSSFLAEAGGSATIPSGDQARTIEAWVKPSDGFCSRNVVSLGTTNTDQGFTLGECPNEVIVDGYQDTRVFSTPRSLDDGSWHFLAATYNDLNGVDQVTAYLDGAPLGTRSFSGTLSTPASSTLWIGAGPNDCCNSFFGGIDEVAVFPTALTSATIASQFALSGQGAAAAPTGITVTPGANSATVRWAAATSASPVTAYLVTAYAGSTPESSVTTASTARTTTLHGLQGATAYTIHVVAYDAYGPGPAGVSSSVTPTGTATTYASTLLGDGPVAYYRLAEAAGAPFAADSSGNGMLATYNASVTTFGSAGALPTDPASSVSDNGGGPVASDTTAGAGKLPVANQSRSFVAWVKPADATCRYVMGYGSQNTDQGFGLATCPNSVQVYGINDTLTFGTSSTLTDGNWHQVAVTFDGTNVTAYADGVSLGTQQFAGTLNTPVGSGLYLGAGPAAAGNFWNGGLDDLAVFPTALSGGQITALFSASGYGVPTAPGSVSATAGTNQATVTWADSSAPNTAVKGYVVTALAGGTVAANAVATSGSESSATITGLKKAPYTFRVNAVDAYGAGPGATSSSVTPTGTVNTYASDVIADGPVAYYRLGESTGTFAADSSGNGVLANYNLNTTTLGTTPGALTHDPNSTAITHNNAGGADASVPDGTTNVLPSGNSARSIAIWIKPSDGACTRYLIGYGTQTTAEGFGLGECPGSVAVTGWSDDLSFSTGAVNLDDGNWHQLVATYDGAGNVTVYVDGTSLGTQALGQPLNTTPNTGLVIGAGVEGYSSDAFFGSLQDAAVFPTALSATQVTTLYGAR